MPEEIRNVAIIAHVDHGKTTLVDALLRQSGNFRESQLQGEAILDANPLERERGITILSKNCAVRYHRDDGTEVKINIIDTPGHADFGGEVERVLAMADGCLLLVDAAEGPMPQTRFVLGKAFAAGLKPIVFINKVDKADQRAHAVLDEIFELFLELGADDKLLDFPVFYGSGRDGWASTDLETRTDNIKALYEAILNYVPAPGGDRDAALEFRVQTIAYSEYVGRIGLGRIYNGTLKSNQQVLLAKPDGKMERAKVLQVQVGEGLARVNVDAAYAGDICGVVGVEGIHIGDSICDPANPKPMAPIEIEPPTLVMIFSVNSSPFAGKEGKFVTSRNLRDRLERELESNVALKVETSEGNDSFQVSGRGLMHLGILIETMRREGFELSVSKPQVIFKRNAQGVLEEPIETLVVDVPDASMGSVMEIVGNRRGELLKMDQRSGITHLEFSIPARGLIGMRTRMMTATAGEAIMHHTFQGYAPMKGEIAGRANGALVSMVSDTANGYALDMLNDRGIMFVEPQDKVYEGQLVGEHNRENDLVVNPCRTKKLTNMRTTSTDEALVLKPARKMTLEQALEYIEDDELVEVTPSAIRLRKKYLTENDRKKNSRSQAVGV